VVSGDSFEVTLEDGARTVKVVAKAKGYRTSERQFAVTKDMVVPIQLRKRTPNDNTPTPQGPIIDL
jgi:hypothetical protein